MSDETRSQFSAKFESPFFGPSTTAPVQRVRDVVICTTDASVDIPMEEVREHPPIASPFMEREGHDSAPCDLGRGVRIERLNSEDAELVMNACSPRGHYFSPVRQFGQRYSFVVDVDLAEHANEPFRWDRAGVLWDALSLSRLIRDNAYSTEYAARVADFADGTQTVVYTLAAESKHVYRLRQDREWLDPGEGGQLRDLLAAYWDAEMTLPGRVRRAMWRTEYSSWLKWGDLVLPTLVGGLEALVKTDRHGATRQFVSRVPPLAAEVDIADVDPEFCETIYDARSDWVHGAHVRLFASGPEFQEAAEAGAQQGPQSAIQRDRFTGIARLQDVLRHAVRRCLLDPEFRATFEDDQAIRDRWPVA